MTAIGRTPQVSYIKGNLGNIDAFNPTNLYSHAEAAATYPLWFFSAAITKSLILPKITTARSYNCYLFLHTLFMVPF